MTPAPAPDPRNLCDTEWRREAKRLKATIDVMVSGCIATVENKHDDSDGVRRALKALTVALATEADPRRPEPRTEPYISIWRLFHEAVREKLEEGS